MASGVKFVRFYPSDWRSGCIGMSFEQEGLYVRMCAYIYETRKRIPASDSAAARILGANTNAYRKVRDQLANLGKIVSRSGEWTVERAEVELAKVDAARSETEVERRANTGSVREAHEDAVVVATHDATIDTPPVQAEKTQCFLRANKEPELEKNNKGDTRANAADATQIEFDGRAITLNGKLRAFWVDQFSGDDARLDLALIQAAAYIQPNSFRPLEAQVGSQLARIAGSKRESDQRYERAAKNRDTKPTASAARMDYGQAKIERNKAFLERLKARKSTEASQ